MQKFEVDPVIRPQDDLFRYVNGPWLARTEIPADKGRVGAFVTLRDDSEAAVKEIVQECVGTADSIAGKIRNLYDSFMDEDAIEAAGLTPLEPVLTRIDEIDSHAELIQFFAWALAIGLTTPITGYVDSDPGDPNCYRFTIEQDGIGLPDEEYYRLPEHAQVREQYRAHIENMLTLGGFDAAAATAVYELEAALAAHHWDKVKCRDIAAGYNPTAVTDLAPEWQELLRAANIHEDVVIVSQPSFLSGALSVLTETDIETWRNALRWQLLSNFAGVLPKAFVEESFDFYSRKLNGIPQIKERWKRGVALVEDLLGEAVGQMYVEKHFSQTAKARMDEMIDNLIEAYRVSISSLTWMTEETRTEALEKLAKFRSKIGYPTVWRDYEDVTIDANTVGNVIRATISNTNDELSKLGGPIRDWEWLMTPQTVNAYYHPLRNEIVFPAAILQPPFFDEDADDSVNYGAIGAVIGHEIGHGFDDQGSTCDGDGLLREWWQPADREAFEALTGKLVDQYQALSPADLPGVFVNGELTLGENIGDLGGLAIAFRAWKLACGDQEPPTIDGFTAEQRFFMSWAHAWQEKIRPEALREQMNTDPHAPDEFRCNQVIRNVDAFYAAFNVQPADALWLNPEDRISIW